MILGIALPYTIKINRTTQLNPTQHVDQRPVEVTSMIPRMLATRPLLYRPAMFLTFLSVTLSLPRAPGLQISREETSPHRPATAVEQKAAAGLRWRKRNALPAPQDTTTTTTTTREMLSFPPKRQRRRTSEYVLPGRSPPGWVKAGHPSPPPHRLSRRGPLHRRRRRPALASAPI